MKKTLFLIFSFVFVGYLHAIQEQNLFYLEDNELKEADEVFLIKYSKDRNLLKINWSIEDGYYLYLDSIKLKKNSRNIQFTIENGLIIDHEDEFFGETKIIRDSLSISSNIDYEVDSLEVLYQGCSDKGFCYPMTNVNIN